MKNKKPHTLDLTPGDIEIIERNLSDSPYIFLNHRNNYLGDFKKAWTCKSCRVEMIVWHDARHTCASELAESESLARPCKTSWLGKTQEWPTNILILLQAIY